MDLAGTILFQGDSITDAFRRPEEINDSYRLGNGYPFIIGSLLRATSGRADLTVQNRGVSGHRAADLLARWQRDCLELRPEMLSLLIGTNDAANPDGEQGFQRFAISFDELLRQTRAALPRCRLILMEPFALPTGMVDAARMQRTARIQAHVHDSAKRLAATFVPLQKAFNEVAGAHPERWIYDGIHPTAAGQWLIAQRWLQEVTGLCLPAAMTMDAST